MNFRFYSISLFDYLTFLFLVSCNTEHLPPIIKEPSFKSMDEGGIIYKIIYPSKEKESFMMDLMPQKMDYYFKGEWTATHLQAGLSALELTFLSNSAEQKLITLVTYGNKKLFYTEQGETVTFKFLDFQNFEITYLDNPLKYMGYNCKKIELISNNNPLEKYEIIYTEEINIQNANWCSLFKKTNGVLLKFPAIFNDMIVTIESKEIFSAVLPSSLFKIPKGFKTSSKEEIKDLIPLF